MPTEQPSDDAPKKRRGVPRNGKHPQRKPWHQAKRHRGHAWAKSNEWYPLAILAYSQWGNQARAATAAGVDRQTLVNRMGSDPEFREAMQESLEAFKDGCLETLDELAFEGEERWVYDGKAGKAVSLGRVRNPLLLMFRIKQLMPEFRDNYKADEKESGKATASIFVQYVQRGNQLADQDLDSLPSFDDFCASPAALPGPAINVRSMSADERRSLMAELAAMDATEEQS